MLARRVIGNWPDIETFTNCCRFDDFTRAREDPLKKNPDKRVKAFDTKHDYKSGRGDSWKTEESAARTAREV